jgi:ATP-dependent DNA ligase
MRTYFSDKPNYPVPSISGSWQYIKYPCAAQIKLDGEFEYLVGDGKEAYLINKYGRVRKDMAITDEMKGFNGVLAGELYYNQGKSFFNDVLTHKFDNALKLYVFDILKSGEIWVNTDTYDYRRCILESVLSNLMHVSDHIRIAEQYICKDKPAVKSLFEKVTAQGYEGLVVKNLSSQWQNGICQSMMKLKKETTADLLAIGYKKAKEAICIGIEAEKPIGAVGNAGHGFLEALALVKAQPVISRDDEYCYVMPIYTVEVKYQEKLKSGMLRSPVFVRLREQGKEVSV